MGSVMQCSADPLSAGQLGQIAALLLFRPKRHQRDHAGPQVGIQREQKAIVFASVTEGLQGANRGQRIGSASAIFERCGQAPECRIPRTSSRTRGGNSSSRSRRSRSSFNSCLANRMTSLRNAACSSVQEKSKVFLSPCICGEVPTQRAGSLVERRAPAHLHCRCFPAGRVSHRSFPVR